MKEILISLLFVGILRGMEGLIDYSRQNGSSTYLPIPPSPTALSVTIGMLESSSAGTERLTAASSAETAAMEYTALARKYSTHPL